MQESKDYSVKLYSKYIYELCERDEAVLVKKISGITSKCPKCDNYDIYDFEGLHYNFCPNCGQRLDWSETDAL